MPVEVSPSTGVCVCIYSFLRSFVSLRNLLGQDGCKRFVTQRTFVPCRTTNGIAAVAHDAALTAAWTTQSVSSSEPADREQ